MSISICMQLYYVWRCVQLCGPTIHTYTDPNVGRGGMMLYSSFWMRPYESDEMCYGYEDPHVIVRVGSNSITDVDSSPCMHLMQYTSQSNETNRL